MHQTLIIELAERARLSVIHSFRVFLEAGYYRGTCQSRQSERPRLSGRDRSCVQSFWAVGSFSVAWELPALPPCRVESLSRSEDNIAPAPQCLNGPKVGNSFTRITGGAKAEQVRPRRALASRLSSASAMNSCSDPRVLQACQLVATLLTVVCGMSQTGAPRSLRLPLSDLNRLAAHFKDSTPPSSRRPRHCSINWCATVQVNRLRGDIVSRRLQVQRRRTRPASFREGYH